MKASSTPTTATIDPARSVADLAQCIPGAARTFEQLGIDYCCHGRESLSEAVARIPLSLELVLDRIRLADETLPRAPRDPALLCKYIVEHHHRFTREALLRLAPLAEKVLRVHGAAHPELVRVRQLVDALSSDLLPHMLKEEKVLFPYIAALAHGKRPAAPFGRIEDPLHAMHLEHDQVGALLRELDELTFGYCPPSGACASYTVLYAGLEDLQADLHEHIHLENHVLFPAGRELARGAQPE